MPIPAGDRFHSESMARWPEITAFALPALKGSSSTKHGYGDSRNNVTSFSETSMDSRYCCVPRLTRCRKLRHLADQNIMFAAIQSPCSPPDGEVQSPSRAVSPSIACGNSLRVPSPSPFRDISSSSDIGNRDSAYPMMVHPKIRESSRSGRRRPIESTPASSFSSPSLSPQQTSPLMSYYRNMSSNENQVWSAPELPMGNFQGLPPPAFIDLSFLAKETSSNIRSPHGHASPFRKSPEPSISRRDNHSQEAHPLPLPPGAPPQPPADTTPVSRSPITPLKSKWQKGKLIGRGTFGSVYVASNRVSGALCAMKEVEIFLGRKIGSF